MKKVTLNLKDLRVESFGAGSPESAAGTVVGAQSLTRRWEATCIAWECYEYTELGWETSYQGGPCWRCV